MRRIEEDAELADRAFQMFRQMQTAFGMDAQEFASAKSELRRRLDRLRVELDSYLASEHGVKVQNSAALVKWRACHQPFHWFIEFYGVMTDGGFQTIIGNPPYIIYPSEHVHYDLSKSGLSTLPTKNLYAFVFERSPGLAKSTAPVGLIVQLTSLSSERLPTLQDLLLKRGKLHAVPFPRRPQSVFEGVEMPVAILLSLPSSNRKLVTSRVNRFYSDERPTTVPNMEFCAHTIRMDRHRVGKFSRKIELDILGKLQSSEVLLEMLTANHGEELLYYQEACRYWAKALDRLPRFRRDGRNIKPPHGRMISFNSKASAAFAACLLNSSLFYWYCSAFSDCEHINDSLIRSFRIPADLEGTQWQGLCADLMDELLGKAERKTISTRQGHLIEYEEISAGASKPIIDRIDRALAKHYGFTNEELDFIINYDIKYRLGEDGADEDDGP